MKDKTKYKKVIVQTSSDEIVKEIATLVSAWKEFYHVEASDIATVSLMAAFFEYMTGGIEKTSLAKSRLEVKNDEKN